MNTFMKLLWNNWKMVQSEFLIYFERLHALIWVIALLLSKHETDK